MEKPSCGCSLFILAVALTVLGACILAASLGSLGVTTSFLRVFPFGSPVWCGALLVIFGLFTLVTYPLSRVHLMATSSKPQVGFILALSLLVAVDCILSIILIVWYQAAVAPTLTSCTPVLFPLPSTSRSLATTATSCECASGFTNPPSLRATIRYFAGVSDCSRLRNNIAIVHWILFGFYFAGAGLAVLIGGLAVKRLHILGVCGNSGVYSVTPEPTTPTTTNGAISSSAPSSCIDRALNGLGRHSAAARFSHVWQSTSNSHSTSGIGSPVRSRLRLVSTPSNSSRV